MVNIVVVEQRRMEGVIDSFLHTVLTLAEACTHQCHATILQYRLHVVEVEIDYSVHGDDFGDALCRYAQCVVGLAEGILHGKLSVDGEEALVVDYEQRINVLRHALHTGECLQNLLLAFPLEWYRDDSHGEDIHRLGYACHFRTGSRSCSATHSGCDEHHLGAVVEHVAYLLFALFSLLLSGLGVVSGSESLFAELQVNRHRRVVESLLVGIAKHESNVVDAFLIHVVHGIATAAAYTNDLYYAVWLVRFAKG